MKIRYAIISETGRRSNNEDYVKVIDNSEESRWFGAVCDGMGGHAMGEIASETVCNAVCDYWERSKDEDQAVKARRACRHYKRCFHLDMIHTKCTLIQLGQH